MSTTSTLTDWTQSSTAVHGAVVVRRVRTVHADLNLYLPAERVRLEEGRGRNPKWLLLPGFLFFGLFVANTLLLRVFPDDPRFANLGPHIVVVGLAALFVGLVLWLLPERALRLDSQVGSLSWDLFQGRRAVRAFQARLAAAAEVAPRVPRWPANACFVTIHDRPFRLPSLLLLLQLLLVLNFGPSPGAGLFLVLIVGLLVLRLSPRLRMPREYWQGLQLLNRERFAAAAETLGGLLQRHPVYQPALELLIETYLRAGWIREAMAACDRLVPVDEAAADAMRERVRLAELVHQRLAVEVAPKGPEEAASP